MCQPSQHIKFVSIKINITEEVMDGYIVMDHDSHYMEYGPERYIASVVPSPLDTTCMMT